MSRRNLTDIQRDEANDHAETKSLEEADCDEHGNLDCPRGQSSPYDGAYCGYSEGFLAAQGISSPTLDDSPECCSEAEECVHSSKYTITSQLTVES